MNSLNLTYANSMRHHPFGYAIYHPVEKTDLKPGSCGYFDRDGVWNPICQIDRPRPSSSAPGSLFTSADEELQKAASQTLHWGPKYSENVTERRLKGKTKMYSLISLQVNHKLHARDSCKCQLVLQLCQQLGVWSGIVD